MKKLLFITLIFSLLLSTNAQKWTEIKKVLPEFYTDNSYDQFGSAISIDGDYAVVGSYGYNTNHGCAYVLYNNDGNWEIAARLVASDSASNHYFGWSASISGNCIVVGARGDSEITDYSGAVYVFEKPDNGWTDTTETAKLKTSTHVYGASLGISVCISDTIILAGAYSDNGNSNESGSAYIFKKPVDGWKDTTETAILNSSDGAVQDKFGESVSIYGDVGVIGAKKDDDNGGMSGSAYIFKKGELGWANMTETAKLTASDGAQTDEFGYSVCISENTVVIGAAFEQDDLGSAYIFEKPAEGWSTMTETAILTASVRGYASYFGSSCDISGDMIVIGAYNDAPEYNKYGRGAVYIFEKPVDGGWKDTTENKKLMASDALNYDNFGKSVAASGDIVLIGADGVAEVGTGIGAVYAFQSLPNNAPTDILLDSLSINENSQVGSMIGFFTTTDIDSNDTFTYSFIDGDGSNDADNDKFTIDGNALKTAIELDFESQTSCEIRVTTNDGWEGIYEKSFTISINDLIDSVYIDTIFCNGSQMAFADSSISDTGIYKNITPSVLGYDSITVVSISYYPVYLFEDTVTICEGDSALIFGLYRDTAKIYTQNLTTINGCDSILKTTLIINEVYSFNQFFTICDGDSILVEEEYLKVAGVYYDSLSTKNGCDSIYITEIFVNDVADTIIIDTICNGDSIEVANKYYKIAGTYYDTLMTSNDCDSIITTQLYMYTKIDFSLGEDTIIVCDNETIEFSISINDINEYHFSNYLGATSDSSNFSFVYDYNNASSGVYAYVIDSNGCKFEDNVRILDNMQGGGASIVSDYLSDPECSIIIYNSKTNYNTAYWSFGDGDTLSYSVDNVIHAYGSNGAFQACFITVNECESDSTCTSAIINNASSNNQDSINAINANLISSQVPVIYPNPTFGQFEISNIIPGTQIEIFGIAGKLIYKDICYENSFEYKFNEAKPGLYCINLIENGIIKQLKILLIK